MRVNREICSEFKVSENKLYQVKRGEENMPRNLAITIARELSGLRMSEIAERYKIASYRSGGKICYRFNERKKRDNKLLKIYNTIKGKCSQRTT